MVALASTAARSAGRAGAGVSVTTGQRTPATLAAPSCRPRIPTSAKTTYSGGTYLAAMSPWDPVMASGVTAPCSSARIRGTMTRMHGVPRISVQTALTKQCSNTPPVLPLKCSLNYTAISSILMKTLKKIGLETGTIIKVDTLQVGEFTLNTMMLDIQTHTIARPPAPPPARGAPPAVSTAPPTSSAGSPGSASPLT